MKRFGFNKRCKNCFAETKADPCPRCGYTKKLWSRDYTVLPCGTRLSNKYQIGGAIGNGGFGITYLAYDIKNEKIIVIKEYFPFMLAHREHMRVLPNNEKSAKQFNLGAERFFDEADTVSRFNGNSGIISIYDCFYANNTAYFAMEYLDGITLERYVQKYGPLCSEEALYIAEKLAMALVVLHSGQVIHRDISPDNVMLCRDGRVKLIDFGAARQWNDKDHSQFTVVMKTGFTPPEQYAYENASDERTDIYALGTLLYFALTGKIPPDSYSRMANDNEFKHNVAGADKGLWEIICHAASVNASERYENAGQFKNALNELSFESRPFNIPDSYDPFMDRKSEHKLTDVSKVKKRLIPLFLCACAALLLCAVILIRPAASQDEKKDTVISETDRAVPAAKITVVSEDNTSAAETDRTVSETEITPVSDDDTSASENDRFISADEIMNIPEYSTPVELPLDGEYQGHIPSSVLKDIGGDVKVTITFRRCEDVDTDDVKGIIPVDSEGRNLLKYMTASHGAHADDNGYINFPRELTEYSFVISQEGIENLGDGGLCFETYSLVILSAKLALSREQFPYNIYTYEYRNIPPVEAAPDGTFNVVFDEYTPIGYDGFETKSIPQEIFYEIDGDVKITLEIEHLTHEYDNFPSDFQVVYICNSGFNFNLLDNDILIPVLADSSGKPLIKRDKYHGVMPDITCGEIVAIIPEQVKDKISGGIFFSSAGSIVKSARLEPYRGEYTVFAELEE